MKMKMMKKKTKRMRNKRVDRAKEMLVNGLFALEHMDTIMRMNDWPKWRKKQFWNDFIRQPKFRESQIKQLLKAEEKKNGTKETSDKDH